MTNVNNNNNAAPAPTPAPPPPDSTLQVEGGGGAKNEPPPPGPPPAPTSPALHGGNKRCNRRLIEVIVNYVVWQDLSRFFHMVVFTKSGGRRIGWTSWKKRWFILTQTSLVFYRSDPNVVSQKLSEVNLTLGGIDLNSSGSVVVKEDKKLITVLFTDGRDGRAFTLKAETLEDLHEWKTALEEALSNAPNAALVMGQNGIFRNDQSNGADASSEVKDRQTPKSLVIGRPVLLALEDIDGTPSFLEKALRFLEEHGKEEKTEFSPEEDPHVIADCVKYVLRELPSSPVPASCCKALLEACRTERSMRISAVRSAICETFPEPNRCLLQRILMMMQSVASNKAVNRMSISAVAACMAPLLLRPLLAGDCDLDNDSDAAGDGSVQLLRAAAAANHAQAIVITLLEEYDNIFGDHAETHEPYTDSEESGSESEEITDDEDYDESFDEEDDVTEGSHSYVEEESEHESSSTTSSKTGENKCSKKVSRSSGSSSPPQIVEDIIDATQILSPSPPQTPLNQHDTVEVTEIVPDPDDAKTQPESLELDDDLVETSVGQKAPELSRGAGRSVRRNAVWGRTPATANSQLQDSLEKWKHDLHERRLALEKDVSTKKKILLKSPGPAEACSTHSAFGPLGWVKAVPVAKLEEQLQKELELKAALEAALKKSQMPLSFSSLVDDKTRAELEEIARAEADVANLKKSADELDLRINQQREHNSKIRRDITNKLNKSHSKGKKKEGGVLAISRASQSLTCRSKHDFYLDKPENERDNKEESQGEATKKKKGSSNVEMGMNRLSMTMSRKSSSKGEGNNSTTSALSKLTNRLNFLKERRSQIASELQNLDKGRSSSSSQPVHNPEQCAGSEHRVENLGNQQEPKGQSPEINYGLISHNNPNAGTLQHANTSEGAPSGERGDSRSFQAGDSKGHSKFPPRTHSR
ncbi:rho GTPase-activating protein ren1 [Phtheirospermum japonicum]|uniref:Rho GTPase-activating protein ren1 n=1 Tax=Phtheirospermum japonicum TaxID=374723 RepID=A0A830CAI8_9LAMI|nr:rho GTPase-activating protein ren1 [Phtheirospermum japonicum]